MNSIKKTITNTGATHHSEGVEALRAFGCIAIVMWHILANGGYDIDGFFAERIIPSWNELVYLFMIISAFGMCSGYYDRIKNNEISIEKFYKKRYNKILPFFSLLIIADVIIEHTFESFAEGVIELTLVFGFLPNNQLHVIGVAWTLGIIFVFYITFPFITFLMANRKRAWFTFAVSIIIQLLCQGYFMTDKFVVSNFDPKHSFLFCVPFFCVGCLLYLYKDNILRFDSCMCLVICCFVTMLYYIMLPKIKNLRIDEIFLLVEYSCWMIFVIKTKSRLLCNDIFKFIGGISMEIYLSHMLCFRILEKFGFTRIFGKGIFSYFFTVSLVIGLLCVGLPVIKNIINGWQKIK